MDRRALIRQYKESPRPAGVFLVRHEPSGRALLGSSPDAPAMLNRIRAQLRMGGHPNRALQRAWNEGTAEDFAFEVVDLLDQDGRQEFDLDSELEGLEAVWREELGIEGSTSY